MGYKYKEDAATVAVPPLHFTMWFTRSFLFATVLFVIASAEETTLPPVAKILSQENIIDAQGKYHWNFESSDGSKSEQEGDLVSEGDTTEEVVKGSFEYHGDGDDVYKVSYVADARGYRPEGDHIPKVPPLIQRALDLLATLPVTTETP